MLQAANRQVRAGEALSRAGLDEQEAAAALSPPPLALRTEEPVNESREKRSGLAFFAALLLYGQLIGLGFLVASGVVEEKASRVVEVLLATMRPRQLLAGKVIGLGVLGLIQLLLIAVLGLAIAAAAGALEVDGDVVVAAALALGWFVVGYVFYAAAFACAGALVARQEELQSVTTPLTLILMVSFFLSFAVLQDPDGTLATVSSFLPPAAPITMPARIALGEAPAAQIAAAFVVTLAAAIALIPLAGAHLRGRRARDRRRDQAAPRLARHAPAGAGRALDQPPLGRRVVARAGGDERVDLRRGGRARGRPSRRGSGARGRSRPRPP